MLTQLLIKNFALIEEAAIPFYQGLTVLTGETGAGKSIVVDAVAFVLGGKADKGVIRHGMPKAYVEATFSVDNAIALQQVLEEQALELEGETLVLSREISQTGRSACRVNGVLVSLSALKSLAALLMEIHGQHEHQNLMDEGNHLHFFDAFGDGAHQRAVQAVRTAYAEVKAVESALEKILKENEFRQERLEKANKQIKEIEKAKLQPGEEEALIKQRDEMKRYAKIQSAMDEALENLSDGGEEGEPALRTAHRAMMALESIKEGSETVARLSARLTAAYYEMEDIAFQLSKQKNRMIYDETELENMENRLDVIRKLEFKYGKTVEEVLAHYGRMTEEAKRLETMEDDIIALKESLDKLTREYHKQAQVLTALRQKLRSAVEDSIDAHLHELNMKQAHFAVGITQDERVSPHGVEKVQFLIQANRGEDIRPLAKTASGGELSRIMLAIKSVSQENTMVPSMVFDEVDTGISGRTAQVVAEKMWRIAMDKQVLCVTHLQQIAAMASHHAVVEKQEKDGRTISRLKYLSDAEREGEVLRMLGETQQNSQGGMEHAKQLLLEAQHYRAQCQKP